MLLSFSGGGIFASGATTYLYNPATDQENTPRLILPVEIEGIQTLAIVDTGAPYVVCAPHVAQALHLDPNARLSRTQVLFRRHLLVGDLHRLNVTIRAEQGEYLNVESTVFVPEQETAESWGALPSFLGLIGCLERFRFAVDPSDLIPLHI